MQQLSSIIDELSSKIKQHEKINSAVSLASVGWHIAHSTIVIKQIIEQLEKSDPAVYKWKFSMPRLVVFLMNKIPRGKGKAPKSVLVDDKFTIETLKKYITVAREKVKLLDSFNPKKNFQHPYFGMLHVKSTLKFLLIHTNHHMQIIDDVINAAK
jgi:hypothetical protein